MIESDAKRVSPFSVPAFRCAASFRMQNALPEAHKRTPGVFVNKSAKLAALAG